MTTYRRLLPVELTEAERAAELDDLGRLHDELRDQGVDVVASIETTPDGDTYCFEWDEPSTVER